MVLLYALTIFTSSALLFFVQPMFARMVLPLLGGSPAVWNTAMVFYQATLLAGYAYVHFGTSSLGLRRHARWHLLVLLLPLVFLPVAVPPGWTPPAQGNPSWWLFGLMAVALGLPFFVVSTTSPLLQKWFAATDHPQAADPYFLYAASNVGSMLALLSYPGWVEPRLYLEQQSRFWMGGYAGLVALMAGCLACLWKSTAAAAASPGASARPAADQRPPQRRRLRWIFLSFVPSSLLLSVTTYLSSDIAVVPLMWILPLSLYLLTFILAFMRHQIFSRQFLGRVWPITLVPLMLAFNIQAALPIGLLLVLHLGAFFVAALFCHTELASDRPAAAHLTEFYLWISVGGVVGGVFTALVAPLIFHSVVEYPLILVLVCLAGLQRDQTSGRWPRLQPGDWLWPALLALLMVGLIAVLKVSPAHNNNAAGYLVFGLPALFCYFFSRRPFRFALGAAAVLLAGGFYQGDRGRVLHTERSFFGVHRVALDRTGQYHILIHGITTHGMQSLDPARRRESLTYYHRTGPIGEVMDFYGRDPGENIAVVGLGAGSLAGFAQSGQSWTFFEIDPVVVKLAKDERFFTFLRDAPANVSVVLGDARLSLAAEQNRKFDLLILDAYSSDAIPMHLVTREALALYLNRLAFHGLLAFHISNVHLDLEPVFANLARDAHLACLTRDDTHLSPEESALGKAPSIWLVMARGPDDFAKLAQDPRWKPSRHDERAAVWTDQYSSILRIFRWQ